MKVQTKHITTLIFSIVSILAIASTRTLIPVTSDNFSIYSNSENTEQSGILPVDRVNQTTNSLPEFIEEVVNGNKDDIQGVYIENILSLPVVDQPSGQPAYVSSIDDVVTNFKMAKEYGVIGLIAHNYLAGVHFFDIRIGDMVSIVNGDGSIIKYRVTDIQEYQAMQPNSPYSDFRDLETNEMFSATELFNKVYVGSGHVTFQTCIWEGDEDSWGRLFVIAEPI